MQTTAGLTMMDIAMLADGGGNLPDDTTRRIAPLLAEDERFAEPLAELHQMRRDAGTTFLADALDVYLSLCRLRDRAWSKPADVLDARLDVPWVELLAMCNAWGERATGSEKSQLQDLAERLIEAFGDEVLADRSLRRLAGDLTRLPAAAVDVTVERVTGFLRG